MNPDPPAPAFKIEPWEVLLLLRLRQLTKQGQDWVKLRLKDPAILDYGRDRIEKLTNGKIEPTIKTTDGA